MNYKETYLKPEIAFLLKKHHHDISKTRYMVNRDGVTVESTPDLDKHYNHLELAYNPNADEVIKHFKSNGIDIHINEVSKDKWEWIISFGNKSIYSGETVNGNLGKNLPQSRQYFNSEKDAYYDCIIELIIII